MSRSRKKTPIIGFICAKSDKPWKAKAARSFRHAVRQALDDEDALLPVKRRLLGDWGVLDNGEAERADVEARALS